MSLNSGNPRIFVRQPKSLMMKRFTPAASAASIKVTWCTMPAPPVTQTAASCPTNALDSSSSVYSILMTGIPDGKIDADWIRLITVTSNPAHLRAALMGVPKLPEAHKDFSKNYCLEYRFTLTPMMAIFFMIVIVVTERYFSNQNEDWFCSEKIRDSPQRTVPLTYFTGVRMLRVRLWGLFPLPFRPYSIC